MRLKLKPDPLPPLLGLYLGLWPLSAGTGYSLNHLSNLTFFLLAFVIFFAVIIYVKSRLNIKFPILIFLFVSLSLWYIVTVAKEGHGTSAFIKGVLWLNPVILTIILANYRVNYRRVLQFWLASGVVINLLFTFALADFNARIGKFYAQIPGFEISSNTLSIYLIFSVVVPALIFFRNYYIKAIFLVLPFIHFSKSHLVIYVLSLLVAFLYVRGKISSLLFGVAGFVVIFALVGRYSVELTSSLPEELNRSLGKMLILSKFTYDFFTSGTLPNFFVIILEVGDGLRAEIYKNAFENLAPAWPFGYSENEIRQAFGGYDFHNMLMYFYYETGIFGLASYILMFFAASSYGAKKNMFGFVLMLSLIYLFLRGLVISIDPFRISNLIVVLLFMVKAVYHDSGVLFNSKKARFDGGLKKGDGGKKTCDE